MKRNTVLTMLFAAVLLLSLPAVAKEMKNKYDCTCSNVDVAGTWGYSETGTAIIYDQNGKPLSTVPYASVGRYTIDRHGNLSGARNASSGGTIVSATITGTAIVNPDCTGTLTLSFWDPSDPTKSLGSAVKFVVYVNDATEAKMIITSTPISYPPPNGPMILGTVLTTDAKKLFPDDDGHYWR
jgi:hypothetical protein